ncbi:MAG TPA: Sua5/YciO/YrdC/YwlC family protein, partial [Syntrophales bacterium]|nr:Sua5/YciO/YrdC/YwlC family protein [Syntrophales bacterium]
MLLSINEKNPQIRLIRKAVEVLRNGGIIVYPTDTVYGIGCDLYNKRAIEKIHEIK